MNYKIIPLHLGETELDDKSKFTYFKNFGQKLKFPFIAWLIEGGEKKILVDSGVGDPAWAAKTRGLTVKPGPAGDFVSTLRACGADPREIDLVICTHLHWDHCFNHRLFTNARLLVQERELIHAMNPIPSQRPIYGWSEDENPPFLWAAGKFSPINGDREILPGISVLHTPGHTPGIQGVLIDTNSGNFFIASDNIPLFESWDTRTPNGIHVSLEEYRRSMERIEALKNVFILPGHDFRVFEKTQYP